MSDSEDDDCPLCCSKMDITDKSFNPCQCGYQVCLWCYNDIKAKLNAKCPACRRLYTAEQVVFQRPEEEALREELLSKRALKEAASSSSSNPPLTRSQSVLSRPRHSHRYEDSERSELQDVRIVQRNLVYVVGLHMSVAKEEILAGPSGFGKYGKVSKVAVNTNKNKPHPQGKCNAYISFERDADAAIAIKMLHGTTMNSKNKFIVRCTYGTTKYCTYWLRRSKCAKPNCLFLHKMGPEADSYDKDDPALHERLQNKSGVHPGAHGFGGGDRKDASHQLQTREEQNQYNQQYQQQQQQQQQLKPAVLTPDRMPAAPTSVIADPTSNKALPPMSNAWSKLARQQQPPASRPLFARSQTLPARSSASTTSQVPALDQLTPTRVDPQLQGLSQRQLQKQQRRRQEEEEQQQLQSQQQQERQQQQQQQQLQRKRVMVAEPVTAAVVVAAPTPAVQPLSSLTTLLATPPGGMPSIVRAPAGYALLSVATLYTPQPPRGYVMTMNSPALYPSSTKSLNQWQQLSR